MKNPEMEEYKIPLPAKIDDGTEDRKHIFCTHFS